jgi:hypothetical protein
LYSVLPILILLTHHPSVVNSTEWILDNDNNALVIAIVVVLPGV